MPTCLRDSQSARVAGAERTEVGDSRRVQEKTGPILWGLVDVGRPGLYDGKVWEGRAVQSKACAQCC